MEHTLALDWQPDPYGGLVVRLLATFTGQPPADATRVPTAMCLVLDRSGSMSGEKLEAAREAAATVATRLHPADALGIVAFDDHVHTLASPAPAAAQTALLDAIRRIQSGGSTNLSGGWLRGDQELTPLAGEGRTARLVLMTDGQANMGIVDPAQLKALAAGARARGITTSTVGFGEDYDEDLLRGMADAGGGNAWYIERPDQAAAVFVEELVGLMSLAAQDVQVALRLRDAAASIEVLQDWTLTPVPGGVRLDLGDLYAREPKRVLARWRVPATFAQPNAVLGELEWSAAVVTATGIERQVVTTPITASFDAQTKVEPNIQREVLTAEVARARHEAVERGDHGDFDGAVHMLRTAYDALSKVAGDDPAAAKTLRDLQTMRHKYEVRDVSAADRKYMKQRAYNARRGKRSYDELLGRDDPKA